MCHQKLLSKSLKIFTESVDKKPLMNLAKAVSIFTSAYNAVLMFLLGEKFTFLHASPFGLLITDK